MIYMFFATIIEKCDVWCKTKSNMWFSAKESPTCGVMCYFHRSLGLLAHLQRAFLNGHRVSERVRTDKKLGKSHSSGPDPNRQAEENRPIPHQNVGENWVNLDKRVVCARLSVSFPGPHGSDPASTRLLHREYGLVCHCSFGLIHRVISVY
jgi:hypothetical protein